MALGRKAWAGVLTITVRSVGRDLCKVFLFPLVKPLKGQVVLYFCTLLRKLLFQSNDGMNGMKPKLTIKS